MPAFRMKVPLEQVEARRRKLSELLDRHSYLPIQELCRLLGVSEATARRDLTALALDNKIIRTFGGALTEFNRRFASFRDRLEHAATSKTRIAAAVHKRIRPGTTCYLDTGTTVYALAELLTREPVRPLHIVTNSLPVGEKLADVEGIDVELIGGRLLGRQSALLGAMAVKSLRFYKIDLAILSGEGANAAGVWNSQDNIVEFQRELLRLSHSHMICLDRTKIGKTAPVLLADWPTVETFVTDASRARLTSAGIAAPKTDFIFA